MADKDCPFSNQVIRIIYVLYKRVTLLTDIYFTCVYNIYNHWMPL